MVHLVMLGVMVLIVAGKVALEDPGAEPQQPIQPQAIEPSQVPEESSGAGAFQAFEAPQRNASPTGP